MRTPRTLVSLALGALVGLAASASSRAEEPDARPDARAAAEKRVLALLGQIGTGKAEAVEAAKHRLAAEEDRFKRAPLRTALACRPASLRRFAAEELGRVRDLDAVVPLCRRALEDTDATVRDACADALRAIDAPVGVARLGSALFSVRAEVRIRAARALGRLGRVEAGPWLVTRWERRSQGAVRAYFATTSQRNYVSEFDTEVAATSFIADPILGVLTPGAVADADVLGAEQVVTTAERVAIHGALVALAGEDLGSTSAPWRAWLDTPGARAPGQSAAPTGGGGRTRVSSTNPIVK